MGDEASRSRQCVSTLFCINSPSLLPTRCRYASLYLMMYRSLATDVPTSGSFHKAILRRANVVVFSRSASAGGKPGPTSSLDEALLRDGVTGPNHASKAFSPRVL